MPELTTEEKQFFATTALSAAKLSTGGGHKGAVLIKCNKLLSIGFVRRIIPEIEETEISAIYDAIFSSRDVNLDSCEIFSSCFPNKEDLKLMVITGIKKVYFLGKIDDQKTVKLINIFSQSSIPIEFIRLQ